MARNPITFRATTEIRAPRHDVWKVMEDVVRWPDWTPTVKSVVPLDNSALMVGRRYRVKQPGVATAVWKTTRVEPNSGFAWEARSPGLLLVGAHDLEGNGPTRVSLAFTLEGPISGFAAWFARAKIQKFLEMEAEALKRRVEGKRR